MKEKNIQLYFPEKPEKLFLEVNLDEIEKHPELKGNPDSRVVANTLKKIEQKSHKIGDGRTAQVRAVEKVANNCVKIVHNKDISPNNVIVEMALMSKCYEISRQEKNGVRIPRPVCAVLFKDSHVYDLLIMERIEGESLKVIIEGNKGIPKSLLTDDVFKNGKIDRIAFFTKVDNFFTKLKRFAKKINQENIYHRDLHEGNIMIDSNGDPVVVDFGESLDSWDPEPYRKLQLDGSVTKWPEDDKAIMEVMKKIKRYLLEEIERKEGAV